MTNYIEEMMRTAGVKPKYIYTVKGQSTTLRVEANWLIWKFKDRKKKSVFKVVKVNKYNPDFTAEKQLEIIKLMIVLAERTHSQLQIEKKDNVWIMYIIGYDSDFEGTYSVQSQDFTQALAQLTTELMNAGELDKTKVKEILEG